MKTAVSKGSDWELDFYSRPILGADGRKRWELLITTTPSSEDGDSPFRFAKICPSGEVNSIWLSAALSEARVFGTPELVEMLLPYLGINSTVQLAQSEISCVVQLLKGNSALW